jgi:hypothetical protein
MWFTQAEFEKHVQGDTLRRLDFSDDGPSYTYYLPDGTYRSVFAATPDESCTSKDPTFQAVAVNNIRPDNTEDWEIATFIAPHPGSFETQAEQTEGFWNVLLASLEPINPAEIDRELNLRYFAWQDQQG